MAATAREGGREARDWRRQADRLEKELEGADAHADRASPWPAPAELAR